MNYTHSIIKITSLWTFFYIYGGERIGCVVVNPWTPKTMFLSPFEYFDFGLKLSP